MTTSAGDKAGPKRPDVFISYSRKDREFVKRLEAALQARGREAWVDWEGIRPAEEFMQAIFPAIEGTDTFVFVISPDSVTSEICGRELAHAASHNKRMVPIFAREVDVKAIPEPLAKLNWVFFCRENEDFDVGTDTLISAIDTDLDWVHAHTRLLTRAIEWETKGKSNSFVLRGEDLRSAEQWLAHAGTEKERQPTALQTEYIIASRKAAARRQRITLGAVTFGLVIALVLAVIAFYQRNLAEERRRQARARELTSEARLAISSPGDGLQRSTLLAIESLNSAWTLDGHIACVNAMRRLPRRPLIRAAHDGKVLALAFSANGRWLASEGTNGKVVIWDTRTQKQITPDTQGAGLSLAALAFSPDGRWLASASEPAALVWDTATWKLVKELPRAYNAIEANREISSVAFNFDGSLLATATHYSPLIAMYDTATWEEDVGWAEATKAAPGATGAQVVAFSPNGKWLVTGGNSLTIWDTATKKKTTRIEKIVPWSFAFSADGEMLAVGERTGRVRLFKIPEDFETPQKEPVPVVIDGGSAVALSPDGNRLASGVRIWNLPHRGEDVSALELPCNASAIVFSPEGSAVITGDTAGAIATWPLTSGAAVGVLPHTAAVTAVAFDRSGALFVTASNVLRIFKTDAAGWSVVAEGKLPSAVSTVGFSPDGLWLVAITGKTVHFFSSGTGVESLPALELGGEVASVSFSPNGTEVATRTIRFGRRAELVNPSKTQVWDLATHREVAWMTHPDEDVRSDTQLSAGTIKPEAGGDTKLATLSASWETLRMGQRAPYPSGGNGSIRSSRSSDGRWSVADGKLSEVQSGREVDLMTHEDAINDAVFSPDAVWLVTASSDRSVRFWPLRVKELRAEAMARLGRNLTYDEWHKFFPDEPYSRTCAALPVHPSVRDKARELATAGDVSGATALFRQVLKAEPTSPFDPAAEARKLAEEAKRAKESKPENSEQPSPGQTP